MSGVWHPYQHSLRTIFTFMEQLIAWPSPLSLCYSDVYGKLDHHALLQANDKCSTTFGRLWHVNKEIEQLGFH